VVPTLPPARLARISSAKRPGRAEGDEWGHCAPTCARGAQEASTEPSVRGRGDPARSRPSGSRASVGDQPRRHTTVSPRPGGSLGSLLRGAASMGRPAAIGAVGRRPRTGEGGRADLSANFWDRSLHTPPWAWEDSNLRPAD
jgi:hypothetical protein